MITHVAIKLKDGTIFSLPAPNRHHNVYEMMADEHNISLLNKAYKLYGSTEGFLKDDDSYLSRKEAYVYAKETGQFNRRVFKGCYNGTELYSEDLW